MLRWQVGSSGALDRSAHGLGWVLAMALCAGCSVDPPARTAGPASPAEPATGPNAKPDSNVGAIAPGTSNPAVSSAGTQPGSTSVSNMNPSAAGSGGISTIPVH